ncbi:MAG: HlyC/CorC family transporter [Candidatus Rokubacteria bacterium]|nr:HlyC/CorC family transporter [Candidatus Rokubacteria bacterium]
MTDSIVLELIALLFLVACSALLTGSEAAYFSLGRARLTRMREGGGPVRLIDRPHELLVTLLVGITMINIGASALAATIAETIFGERFGLAVEMIGMVLLLTTFGEVLPMTLAVKYPERFLALAHRPIGWLGGLLTFIGLRAILGALTAMAIRLFGRGSDKQPELTEEELRTLVDVGATEGVVEREEREMIHGVFELEDTLVRSVMVPRTDMFCLDVDTPAGQILPALRENLHSRVPVYEESIDVIVGVLYTKELLKYMRGLPRDFDLRAHLHPPYFVPETKRADALLQEFQAKRLHMAIVVDEYGGTAGLVSLEDLIEEVVGEIVDEYDEPERLLQKIDATTYRVAGKLPIDELNTAVGLSIPNEEYDTVGGWVLDLFGRVPRKAERKETADLSVIVEKVERTRVVEVLVTLRKPPVGEVAA